MIIIVTGIKKQVVPVSKVQKRKVYFTSKINQHFVSERIKIMSKQMWEKRERERETNSNREREKTQIERERERKMERQTQIEKERDS